MSLNSLIEENIRLPKIVIFLFFSVRFYCTPKLLSRFKAVRFLARMCPCEDPYEPSLLERISVIFRHSVHNHLLLIIGLDKHHFLSV